MYKIKDFVVYKHDVCIINEIRKIKEEDYYILIPIRDNSLTLSIPTSNRFNLIRDIISKEDSLKLLESIKNIEPLDNISDKYIENNYKELLNDLNHTSLIKLMKTCYLRNKERLDNNKKVSEKDKLYLEKAESYLFNELSISLSISYNEVEKLIIDKLEN